MLETITVSVIQTHLHCCESKYGVIENFHSEMSNLDLVRICDANLTKNEIATQITIQRP